MKKKAILFVVIALLFLWGVVYLWGPSSAPAGQEPLTVLSKANFAEFAAAFDGDTGIPRLVLLLSPT